jgi:hypothetical protein
MAVDAPSFEVRALIGATSDTRDQVMHFTGEADASFTLAGLTEVVRLA